MSCAVLCIGTELTRGELVNSNAAWLAAGLTELGFEVTENLVVDDDRGRIVAALARLGREAEVVVCTGGLGPTTDDLTTDAVAQALGVPLERDEASLESIRQRMARFGRTMSPTNAKQADFPRGATVLANPVGTAPGFSVRIGGAQCFFMPGVPREMKTMFTEQVVPRIDRRAPKRSCQVRLRTFGLPESVVGERLAGIEEAHPGIILGYRAHFPEIEVKVLAHAETPEAARAACDRAAAVVRARLTDVIFGSAEDTFAGVTIRALRERGLKLAIAESCTGGLVAHLVTREAGASDVLLLDAVTYADGAKTKLLGVDPAAIRAHGAVSPEVARAMAEGVRAAAGPEALDGAGVVTLAITGIAGPGGGSETKPVGTVHFAVTAPGLGTVFTKHRLIPGDRDQVQTLAAYVGLELVRRAALGTLTD